MSSDATKIVLQIGNSLLECDKSELSENSDYFKVMFEGDFAEKDKDVIKLEDVDLNSMKVILKLLRDINSEINEEDVVPTLQTSCMLQFVEIKNQCIKKVISILSPKNCTDIWLIAEQLDIQELYLKSRSMMLMEFNTIKDTDTLLALSLEQLCKYLASTSLQCKSEMHVFQECMKWWTENSENLLKCNETANLESFYTNTFFCLLSCISYRDLSKPQIEEILAYPVISKNKEIVDIFNCLIDLKQELEPKFNEQILTKATSLLNSKPRVFKQYPCILINIISTEDKQKLDSLDDSQGSLNQTGPHKNRRVSERLFGLVYYDPEKKKFVKFVNLDKTQYLELFGFKLAGYKELIIILGGENYLGSGSWNRDIWIYNTIKDVWQCKTVSVLIRRHFEVCVCDDRLYVIGGIGKFRVLQPSVLCYNITEGYLEAIIPLPCPGYDTKCCCWNNKPLLINITDHRGYLYNTEKKNWRKLTICDKKQFLTSIKGQFVVVAYEDKIYIKGDGLIEMKLIDDTLMVMDYNDSLESIQYTDISSIICGNILYTLYKEIPLEADEIHNTVATYEKYDFNLKTQEFIFKNVNEVVIENDTTVTFSTELTAFHHYNLINDEVINNSPFSKLY